MVLTGRLVSHCVYSISPTMSNINVLFYLFCLIIINTTAFNFYPKHAHIFTNNNPNSYFGYSVLLQKSNGVVPSRLIVGSPRANSSFSSLHKQIVQPGAVYSCPLNGVCKQFLFDSNGNTYHKGVNGLSYEHKKDNSWLGNAIDGEDVAGGLIVACAPRWINQIHKDIYYLLNGLCYLAKDTYNIEKKAEELIPLLYSGFQGFKHGDTNVYFYALGQAGMSVHLAKNNSEILIGAPGVLQWKGMIAKYYDGSTLPGVVTQKSYSKYFDETEIPNPSFIPRIENFSYLGYASASGKFVKNSSTIWYVGGAPRGKNLYGQVLVYEYISGKDDLLIHLELNGRQAGEYFGAVLAVGDLNNDEIDDILVGAPMYSTERGVEVGCVYAYINDGLGTLDQVIINGPQQAASRFGTAISVIGDINKDGILDFAVGAPYYDSGKGAIFIYLGSKYRLSQEYSQKILASDVSPLLRGFGSSFSRGVDIDENKYKDLAVGAYKSGHAIILKSRPVITIDSSLLSLSQRISIDTKEFKISACLTYHGDHVPDVLTLKMTLIADQYYKRVYFTKNSGTKLDMSKQFQVDKKSCENLDISVTDNKFDFTQPISIQMAYEIVENINDDKFCSTCPVVDYNSPNTTLLKIPFETGCGLDNICQPDLILSANFLYDQPYLVIGSRDRIDIKIMINNRGEPAFISRFYAEIPSNTAFDKIPNKCQQIKNDQLMCEIGNPMFTNTKESLVLQLDISSLGNNDNLRLKLNVTSSGNETNIIDNTLLLELPLKAEAEISILGLSTPDQYTIVDENKVLKQDVFTFSHQFSIHNLGPSVLDDLELEFLIPYKIGSTQIIKIFKPSLDNSLICSTSEKDGFYLDKDDKPVDLEIRNLSINDTDTRVKRSNIALYSKMQKLIASDREIPQDLPKNRTFSLSCKSPEIDLKCFQIKCISGPLKKSHSQAQATLTFQLEADLKTLDEIRNEKDIIVITSSVQPISKYFKSEYVFTHTILLGSLRPESAIKWIILGLVVGLILFIAIVFGLYKTGFFNRKNHEKLLNEKEEEEAGSITMNSTSGTE